MILIPLYDISGALICYRSPARVLTLLALERAVAKTEQVIEIVISEMKKIAIPAAIMLLRTIPWARRNAQCLKANVIVRDENTCQYCGKKNLTARECTIDHVVPKVKGGKTEWSNVVVSCFKCNTQIKQDKTLKECGLTLLRKPYAPSVEELFQKRNKMP